MTRPQGYMWSIPFTDPLIDGCEIAESGDFANAVGRMSWREQRRIWRLGGSFVVVVYVDIVPQRLIEGLYVAEYPGCQPSAVMESIATHVSST